MPCSLAELVDSNCGFKLMSDNGAYGYREKSDSVDESGR